VVSADDPTELSKALRAKARDLHKIPWDEPGFSERMLREHLSQAHDGASRRFEIIDAQVKWIDEQLLSGRTGRVLDLGCGPGFYTERLAAAGHRCKGIDFSPASIRYAMESSAATGLEYVCGDVRTVEYGGQFDLMMMLSGELNMFSREDARVILTKARKSLAEGGRLLLEVHTLDAVRRRGKRNARRYATTAGPFSDRAHSVVEEHEWDEGEGTAHTSYFVIDAATAEVAVYGETAFGYAEDELLEMVRRAGFSDPEIDATFPSVPGTDDLIALVARAQPES
jgi:SAM-dependent methyltransferase